eukprot:7159110-Prymnesium_polylepis.1
MRAKLARQLCRAKRCAPPRSPHSPHSPRIQRTATVGEGSPRIAPQRWPRPSHAPQTAEGHARHGAQDEA